MAGDYSDASLARNLIIEVRRADGLLLIGPSWLKGSRFFQESGRSSKQLCTQDRFWLTQTINGDANTIGRLRTLWNRIDPMVPVLGLSNDQLIALVSDEVVGRRVAALFLSSSSSVALPTLQAQLQAARHDPFLDNINATVLSGSENDPVYKWSKERKLQYVLDNMDIEGEIGRELKALTQPPQRDIFLGSLVLILGAQLIPGAGEAVDIGLAYLAYIAAGLSGLSAIRDLVYATIDVFDASTKGELDAVALRYAKDLVALGTSFLTVFTARLGLKRGGGGGGGGAGEAEDTFRPLRSDNWSRPQEVLSEPQEAEVSSGPILNNNSSELNENISDIHEEESVFHVTSIPGAANSIIENGIDPVFFNSSSRFGPAFYVAEQPETALGEVSYYGADPNTGIKFLLDNDALNVLDLTNPDTAAQYGYSGGAISPATQAIGSDASASGYNAIRYYSERVPGGTNLAVLSDYNTVLKPVMVTPAQP